MSDGDGRGNFHLTQDDDSSSEGVGRPPPLLNGQAIDLQDDESDSDEPIGGLLTQAAADITKRQAAGETVKRTRKVNSKYNNSPVKKLVKKQSAAKNVTPPPAVATTVAGHVNLAADPRRKPQPPAKGSKFKATINNLKKKPDNFIPTAAAKPAAAAAAAKPARPAEKHEKCVFCGDLAFIECPTCFTLVCEGHTQTCCQNHPDDGILPYGIGGVSLDPENSPLKGLLDTQGLLESPMFADTVALGGAQLAPSPSPPKVNSQSPPKVTNPSSDDDEDVPLSKLANDVVNPPKVMPNKVGGSSGKKFRIPDEVGGATTDNVRFIRTFNSWWRAILILLGYIAGQTSSPNVVTSILARRGGLPAAAPTPLAGAFAAAGAGPVPTRPLEFNAPFMATVAPSQAKALDDILRMSLEAGTIPAGTSTIPAAAPVCNPQAAPSVFQSLVQQLQDTHGDAFHQMPGWMHFRNADTIDKGVIVENFIRSACKPGGSKERYMPESMRSIVNGFQSADLNAERRKQQSLPPEKRKSQYAYSWCDIKGTHAADFAECRRALADLRVWWRNIGLRRGQGASTATAALVPAQAARIRRAYLDYIARLDEEGALVELLPGLSVPKTGVNAYGRILEATASLVMLDLGTFGGGRARNDYSLYRVRDILFTPHGARQRERRGRPRPAHPRPARDKTRKTRANSDTRASPRALPSPRLPRA